MTRAALLDHATQIEYERAFAQIVSFETNGFELRTARRPKL